MNYTELSCEEFIEILASKAPVPGGGGASALVGAIGVALGNMVGSLTISKKKYANVQEEILTLKSKANQLQKELMELVAKDAENFEPLCKAYSLPQNTEEQRAEKAHIMEIALDKACDVPIRIMEKCCLAIELHREFASKGTSIAISDIGVGVEFCKASLIGASLNIFINTNSMLDLKHAENINQKAYEMLTKYTKMSEEIYSNIVSRFHEGYDGSIV